MSSGQFDTGRSCHSFVDCTSWSCNLVTCFSFIFNSFFSFLFFFFFFSKSLQNIDDLTLTVPEDTEPQTVLETTFQASLLSGSSSVYYFVPPGPNTETNLDLTFTEYKQCVLVYAICFWRSRLLLTGLFHTHKHSLVFRDQTGTMQIQLSHALDFAEVSSYIVKLRASVSMFLSVCWAQDKFV